MTPTAAAASSKTASADRAVSRAARRSRRAAASSPRARATAAWSINVRAITSGAGGAGAANITAMSIETGFMVTLRAVSTAAERADARPRAAGGGSRA